MRFHQGEHECVSGALPDAQGRPAQLHHWSQPHHLKSAAAPAAAALQQTQAFRHCQGNETMHALSDMSGWRHRQELHLCFSMNFDWKGHLAVLAMVVLQQCS